MGIIALLLTGIMVYGFCYYENNGLKTTKIDIKAKIKNELRIVQISDLHSKEFGRNNKKLFKTIMEEKPDIVVATGDLIDSNMKNIDGIVMFLSELNKSIPVFYIPGNNEMRCEKLHEILEKLKEVKVEVLMNRIITRNINGNIINILGIVEEREDKGEFFYDKIKSRYTYREYNNIFKKLESMKGIKIVLSHYPENFEYIKEYSYNNYNFDIMFSGHAHGGQFILPFIGGIFAPGQGMFPKYYKGIYGGKNKLVVSRGLGNSGFPLRLFNRPDIVVVDIK